MVVRVLVVVVGGVLVEVIFVGWRIISVVVLARWTCECSGKVEGGKEASRIESKGGTRADEAARRAAIEVASEDAVDSCPGVAVVSVASAAASRSGRPTSSAALSSSETSSCVSRSPL